MHFCLSFPMSESSDVPLDVGIGQKRNIYTLQIGRSYEHRPPFFLQKPSVQCLLVHCWLKDCGQELVCFIVFLADMNLGSRENSIYRRIKRK